MYKLNIKTTFIGGVVLADLLDALLNKVALGASISFSVTIKNNQVGVVNMSIEPNTSTYNDVLSGSFTSSVGTLDALDTSYGINHLNWLQIAQSGNFKPQDSQGNPVSPPFIDPLNSGYAGLPNVWADNIPWYYDEFPKPSTDNRLWPPTALLDNERNGSILNFSDAPGSSTVGTTVSFDTFLIADFGNKTYDTLGGFSWSFVVYQNGFTIISFAQQTTPTVFTNADAQEVSNEFPGYTKVDKLPTYSFDGNLVPGAINSLQIPGLSASQPFAAWTDNLPGINPSRTPDTVLGKFDQSNQLIVDENGIPGYNDDGGPFENNYGSGLTGKANNDGTINLKVTGYPDFSFT